MPFGHLGTQPRRRLAKKKITFKMLPLNLIHADYVGERLFDTAFDGKQATASVCQNSNRLLSRLRITQIKI